MANNSPISTNSTEGQYSTHSSTIITVHPRNSTPILKYTDNEDALKVYSPFYKHTYDAHYQYPVDKHKTISNIRFGPWNDSINYARICQRILQRITQNNTYYIISGNLIGGLGH